MMHLWIYEDGSTSQNTDPLDEEVMDAIEAGTLQVFRFTGDYFEIADVETDEEDEREITWGKA